MSEGSLVSFVSTNNNNSSKSSSGIEHSTMATITSTDITTKSSANVTVFAMTSSTTTTTATTETTTITTVDTGFSGSTVGKLGLFRSAAATLRMNGIPIYNLNALDNVRTGYTPQVKLYGFFRDISDIKTPTQMESTTNFTWKSEMVSQPQADANVACNATSDDVPLNVSSSSESFHWKKNRYPGYWNNNEDSVDVNTSQSNDSMKEMEGIRYDVKSLDNVTTGITPLLKTESFFRDFRHIETPTLLDTSKQKFFSATTTTTTTTTTSTSNSSKEVVSCQPYVDMFDSSLGQFHCYNSVHSLKGVAYVPNDNVSGEQLGLNLISCTYPSRMPSSLLEKPLVSRDTDSTMAVHHSDTLDNNCKITLSEAPRKRRSRPDTNAKEKRQCLDGEREVNCSMMVQECPVKSNAKQLSSVANVSYSNTTPGAGGAVTMQSASEKRFSCTYPGCCRTFTRSDELRRHNRTHSDDRPHTCEFCMKRFTRSDHLRTHRRTHTGEKPFPCEQCDKCFARSDERTRHKKTHEKERRNLSGALTSSTTTTSLSGATSKRIGFSSNNSSKCSVTGSVTLASTSHIATCASSTSSSSVNPSSMTSLSPIIDFQPEAQHLLVDSSQHQLNFANSNLTSSASLGVSQLLCSSIYGTMGMNTEPVRGYSTSMDNNIAMRRYMLPNYEAPSKPC